MPETAESKLCRLATLQSNWDGYGAEPITAKALETARHMLMFASVVPVSEHPGSGVQIEWHQDGYDVEIHIGGDGKIRSLFAD